MGSTAGCLFRWACWVRDGAGSGGDRGADLTGNSGVAQRSAGRGGRARHGGLAGRGRRCVGHVADGRHGSHSGARPGGVPRLRTGAPAGGRRVAYRHRHGVVRGAHPVWARVVGAGGAALAVQDDRRIGRPCGGWRVPAANGWAPADPAQLHDGEPSDAWAGAGTARAVAARAGAGGFWPDGRDAA